MLTDNILPSTRVGAIIKIIQKTKKQLFTQSQLERWLVNIENNSQFVRKT
jgi:hypothetical protein